MNEEFVVKTSIGKTILFLIGCLAFITAGVFIISLSRSLFEFIAGILCIGFFGLGFFVLLFRGLLDRRPLISIDEKGINDRRLGVGRINWEDIKFIKLNSDNKNSSISLKLLNSEKYLKNLPRASKILSRFNGDLDFGILNINLSLTNIKPQKVYEVILKHIPEKQLNNSDKMYEDFDRASEIK